ncbi:hypothetical protein EG68_03981 [Paragonimus skrjabini miyazakii]|uniref:Threonylcarbamoyl-AMP synthase n=1 Tax=Paragonimus skrjabini miyazakii TaxID=59628 RepID=A0A8S9Z6B2_9TREM|nr:hypothetical protein EG68_03981 [Paragonimus skrjabini miyazakii]
MNPSLSETTVSRHAMNINLLKILTKNRTFILIPLSKISSVTQLIRNGGVIALPTDTIYGVACSIDSAQALMRIQQLKGRSPNKPMAICVDKVSRIPHWCDTTSLPNGLLNDLLPGPVTVLLPRLNSNHCLDRPHLNPGVQMVGVRVPDHGFIQSLVSALSETEPNETTNDECISAGHPLVLTSANLSGNASALTIEEFSSIWPALDLIIDGGVISGTDPNDSSPPSARSGSTIVDLSQASKQLFRITRDGSALESTVKTLEQTYGMRWLKSNSNSPAS